MKVQFDPEQLAEMGITENISLDLPDGFESFTRDQRRAWARRQMEAVAMALLDDLAAAHGVVATAAQKAAYLRDIQPGLDEAMASGH